MIHVFVQTHIIPSSPTCGNLRIELRWLREDTYPLPSLREKRIMFRQRSVHTADLIDHVWSKVFEEDGRREKPTIGAKGWS
ncbi:hypothetical protein J2P12_08970 [Candidatus Bathyarchaeota archaeon]|nr:hypothetical protein [Candidatus Bathyarchaeota archaeon]